MVTDAIPAAAFLHVVDADLEARGLTRRDLGRMMTDRFGEKPDTHTKRLWAAGRDGTITISMADRYLVVLGLHLDDIPGAPTPPAAPRRRGGGKPAGVYGYLTDTQLKACHVLYEQGLSVRAVAERIHPRTRYATTRSCAMALLDGWRRLGLPTRDRIHATRLASTVHGLHRDPAHRHALRVARGEINGQPCEGRKTTYPGRGRPCQLPAMRGERFCRQHHPDMRDQVLAELERARKTGVAP